MRLVERQLRCSRLRQFTFYILFIFALSFESSLNRDETVSGKVVAKETGSSQVELEPAGNKVICEIVVFPLTIIMPSKFPTVTSIKQITPYSLIELVV